MVTGFFDEPRPSGTNRAAPPSDCVMCGGDRLVLVEHVPGSESAADPPHEVYARCPSCNPDPKAAREPVQGARWQDYDR